MSEDRREVVVTDIKIPFWSMVVLMVKWVVAAIPAVIILMLIAALVSAALSMLIGGGWQQHYWGMSRGWS
jgi:hypothetical protein